MKNIILTFGLLLFFGLLYAARSAVLISLIGVGIGVLIMPLLDRLRRRYSVPRAMSAMMVLVVLTIIFSGVGFSVYYLVADQAESLTLRAPQLSQTVSLKVTQLVEKFPWMKSSLKDFNIDKSLQDGLVTILHGFQFSLVALSGFAFSILIGLYTAVGAKEYWRDLIEAFPKSQRVKAALILSECAQVLRQWFKAQLMDMLIIGALTAIGLWIAGVEYWAVYGLLTAVLGIIPYAGILIVVSVAGVITLATNPSQIWAVLLVFGITQQIEGNFILPMVMKGQVQLPEVPLLIFILTLGTFFGVLGVFMAPALFAVLKVIYNHIYLPVMETK